MKEINSSEDTNNDCLRTGQEGRGMTVRKGKKLLQRVMRKHLGVGGVIEMF